MDISEGDTTNESGVTDAKIPLIDENNVINKKNRGGTENNVDNEVKLPIVATIKCNICKREIPAVINDEKGLVAANKFKKLHNEYEDIKCEGILEYIIKKKKQVKEDKVDDDNNNNDTDITFDNIILTKGARKAISAFQKYYVDPYELGFESDTTNIILYGPHGTGKSILLKAFHRTSKFKKYCDTHVITGDEFSGDLKEVISMAIDRFKEAKKAYDKSKKMQIFLIDELGSIFDSRNTSVKSVKRLTETLLSLIDGLLSTGAVSIIGSTNYLDSIDEAILDRFDEKIYFGEYEPKERIEFCKMYLSVDDIPLVDIDYNEIWEYTVSFNGREYRRMRRELKWWYRKYKKTGNMTQDDIVMLMLNIVYRKYLENSDMTRHSEKRTKNRGRSPFDCNII